VVLAANLLAFQPWPHPQPSSPVSRVQLFVLVAGLVLALVGYSPVIRSGYWRLRAKAATGWVVDHVGADPVVEFEVRNIRVRFRDSQAPSAASPVGSTVRVLYDPEDPQHARLADPAVAARPTAWLAVGLAVVVGGILFTWL